MNDDTLFPFLAIFASAGTLFFVIWWAFASMIRSRRTHMEHRMSGGDSTERPILREDFDPGRPDAAPTAPMDLGFQRMIARTGLDIDSSAALGIIVFCGTALATGLFLWRSEEEPWVAIPGFLLGAAIPLMFFAWRQQVYRRALREQLPDVIYLLGRSLRAGRSLEQAFQLVGDQGLPPWSREFSRMFRQLELGLSLNQVLQSTRDRLGVVDFNIFASVLVLHRSIGGSLPNLLDRLAATTRDRNQFDGQFRAATVLGRYSAAFISFLVGVILVYLFFFHREWATRFFDTTYGYAGVALFMTAMACQILGGVLLYFLMRYDY